MPLLLNARALGAGRSSTCIGRAILGARPCVALASASTAAGPHPAPPWKLAYSDTRKSRPIFGRRGAQFDFVCFVLPHGRPWGRTCGQA